jgi:hypothetical protein
MEADYLARKGRVTADDLVDVLDDNDVVRGATKKECTLWLKNRRRKDAGDVPQHLSELKDALKRMLKQCVGWKTTKGKDGDDHRRIVLPLPKGEKYIFIGKEVSGKNPRTLKDGTKFSFLIPMSTRALLRRIIEQLMEEYSELDEDCFDEIFEKGFRVKPVDSKGFVELDGIPSAIRGAHILVFGTVTKNGHFRRAAYAVASDESGEAVRLFLQSIHLACKKLFKEESRFRWFMADMGGGIRKGVKDYAVWMEETAELESADEVKKADCFAHLMNDNMPKLASQATSKDFYNAAMDEIRQAAQFPSKMYGRV